MALGYCYQGAFFSPHHFAEMKEMFDKQLQTYEAGCRMLPRTARRHNEMSIPMDLPSLKKFLDAGKRNRKRKQNKKEFNELQKVVTSIAKDISRMDKKSRPKGVILYFEGLDCSGKSSTGGLVQQVLEQAGYNVLMRQYNRPPTAEQQKMDWMDRFEVPGGEGGSTNLTVELTPKDTTDHDNELETKPIALVWDRGPAGDFVYGGLNNMSSSEKARYYDEFIAFDHRCQENDILFLKLLFVTNRDSIASTLGKRLAQKHMARDLKSWLRACTPSSVRGRGDDEKTVSLYAGLNAIAGHIDPTDFIAFNNYERNLQQFANFALNTETKDNPWVVVNTVNRYDARKSLLKVFRSYLHRSSKKGSVSTTTVAQHKMDMNTMMTNKFAMSNKHRQLISISIMGLLLLLYIYLRKLTAE